MRQRTSERRIFRRDPYTSIVAFVISVVAVVAAGISALESDASLRASKFTTLAQVEIIEATRVQTVGVLEINYAWSGAYRLWIENNAQRAFFRDNDRPFEPYLAARDRVEDLTRLFTEAYYDAETRTPFLETYEADAYVREYTLKTQRYRNYQQLVGDWDEKADNYINYLSWLTFALILLGFSVTIITDVRLRLLILLGSLGIIGSSIFQTYANYVTDVNDVPETALQHYADGVAAAHQFAHEQAIAAFDSAIATAPNYTAAYVQRGFAARTLYNSTGDPALLSAAAADFEQAIAAGRDEVNTIAQLSEIYFVLGAFAESVRVAALGSQQTGDWVHDLDRGRSLLASGDIEGARASYDVGLQNAIAQHAILRQGNQGVPLSFWLNFDVAFLELDYMLSCLVAEYCVQSPPLETLPQSQAVIDAATEFSRQIKTTSASLDFLGMVASYETDATFEPMAFYAADAQEPGFGFVGGSQPITVRTPYTGMRDGQTFAIRVYVNDRQYLPLQHVETWTAGTSGTHAHTLQLGEDYGFYIVQYFVDGVLVQEGGFQLDF